MNQQPDLVVANQAMSAFLPVMQIQHAIERYNAVLEFTQKIMHQDKDYGSIPGTSKPTLLKPGAEKLCSFFGLTPRYTVVEKSEDWTGVNHGGEPHFYYWYTCALWRGDQIIAEADGSCNSWETKYRYRSSERLCPSCGKPAIIKGKEEYGGGWLCFGRKGGCNAKFRPGDKSIEDQQTGRVANPDIADQVNTLQKMAQKRALIAATLVACNASEYFTQDMEDLHSIEVPFVHVAEQAPKVSAAPVAPPVVGADAEIPEALQILWARLKSPKDVMSYLSECKALLVDIMGSDIEYYAVLRRNQIPDAETLKHITMDKARVLTKDMQETVVRTQNMFVTPQEVA
jgi:hypothetical protein